jgi:hypothetical protein
VKECLQDGNRDWITCIACVCANGEALPPSLIYPTKSGDIQSSWVASLELKNDELFIAGSPTGWSNDKIGLAWLEQVYDRCTRPLRGNRSNWRQWRLLILDRHGSHVTMKFIDYYDLHRILLLVFPPYSTHTLQPLDVVIFKPLSAAYYKALTNHLHLSQGFAGITKADFLPLFKQAWRSTFTPELILKSFTVTGIWPLNADVVLQKFTKTTVRGSPSNYQLGNRYYTNLLKEEVKDPSSEGVKELILHLDQTHAQRDLSNMENIGLRASFHYKKKYKHKGYALDLQQREEYYSWAVFYSPRKVNKARFRRHMKEQEERELQLRKVEMKEERLTKKLRKQKEQEERRLQREEAKVVKEKEREERAKEKAEKMAEKARQKEAYDAQKAIKTSQKGKRQPSPSTQLSNKRQKRLVVSLGAGRALERAPSLPAKTTSRGRNVHLPSKFR